MKRVAPFHILVIALAVLLVAGGCSSGGESQTREELGEPILGLPTAEAKDLASLGQQAAVGDSLTLDASVLPGPIGEPALSGNIMMTVNSTERDVKVEEDTVPKLGGAYGAGLVKGEQYTAKRGVYFIVNYSVKNETDGLVKPGAHINNGFTLADATGREWKPMTFQQDHFDGSAALRPPAGPVRPARVRAAGGGEDHHHRLRHRLGRDRTCVSGRSCWAWRSSWTTRGPG